MKKLKLKNIEKEISNSVIKDMAENLCLPAFYEYLRRYRAVSSFNAKQTSKQKRMLRDLKRLHQKFTSTHRNFSTFYHFQTISMSEINEEAKKLTLISNKLYESPVRALVSPLNTWQVNNSFMKQKLGLKVGHIADDLNKNTFRFEDEEKLDKNQMMKIKASVLFLNWFLVKPVYIRPVVGFMKFTFNPKLVKDYESMRARRFLNFLGASKSLTRSENELLISHIKGREGKYFVRYDSDKLGNFLNTTSEKKLRNIKRLYNAIYQMGLVENDFIDRLPIFVLLNKYSLGSDYKILKKLFDIGYNRMLHLRFFETDASELMMNGKIKKVILKMLSADL